jgi:hypothetical protein
MRILAELHNQYVVDLTKDEAKVARDVTRNLPQGAGSLRGRRLLRT